MLRHTSYLMSLYTNPPTHKGLPLILKLQSADYISPLKNYKADNTFYTNLDIYHYISKYLVISAENIILVTSQATPLDTIPMVWSDLSLDCPVQTYLDLGRIWYCESHKLLF